MTTIPKLLIITDLDGTLPDRKTHSFDPVEPAPNLIWINGMPLVRSSGKTRGEIELHRNRLEEVLGSIKRETGIQIKGFSDLPEEALASLCGLSLKEA